MIDYAKVPMSKVKQIAYNEGYQHGKADALKEAKDYISQAIGHDGRNGWSASTWKGYIEGCFDELMKGAEEWLAD